MYFKTYAPATLSQNCETARAFHTYNAVCRASGKNKPRFNDYLAYIGTPLELVAAKILKEEDWEISYNAYIKELRMAWEGIKETIRNAGQPLRKQFVVYFAIIDGGIKKGQTRNLVQRYGSINRETPIEKLWYLPVESEEASLLAEEILGDFFDHARAMKRCRGKDDYYQCDEEAAQRFIAANSGKIYQAITEAIEGI